MISLSHLFEILGDPKWTKRLEDKVTSMPDNSLDVGRAHALATKNKAFENKNSSSVLRKMITKSANTLYNKYTDQKYPKRTIVRSQNRAEK